jgi:hypothetical protein
MTNSLKASQADKSSALPCLFVRSQVANRSLCGRHRLWFGLVSHSEGNLLEPRVPRAENVSKHELNHFTLAIVSDAEFDSEQASVAFDLLWSVRTAKLKEGDVCLAFGRTDGIANKNPDESK